MLSTTPEYSDFEEIGFGSKFRVELEEGYFLDVACTDTWYSITHDHTRTLLEHRRMQQLRRFAVANGMS